MPHVRFSENFDWSPRYGVTIAYEAGWLCLVTTRCAESAVKKGKAEKLPTPKRESVNGKS